eukprot:766609-Hanusia_phi.AAC.1
MGMIARIVRKSQPDPAMMSEGWERRIVDMAAGLYLALLLALAFALALALALATVRCVFYQSLHFG